MHYFEEIKKWLGEITEISLLLIAFGVVGQILFGQSAPFFGGIITNLTGLLSKLGENGLTGLLAAGVILFLFNRQKPQLVGAVTNAQPKPPAPAGSFLSKTNLEGPAPASPDASPSGASRGGGHPASTRLTPASSCRKIGAGAIEPAGEKPTIPPKVDRSEYQPTRSTGSGQDWSGAQASQKPPKRGRGFPRSEVPNI